MDYKSDIYIVLGNSKALVSAAEDSKVGPPVSEVDPFISRCYLDCQNQLMYLLLCSPLSSPTIHRQLSLRSASAETHLPQLLLKQPPKPRLRREDV